MNSEIAYKDVSGGGPSNLIIEHLNNKELINLNNKKICDIGCGICYAFDKIKQISQPSYLVGCDISERSLKQSSDHNKADELLKLDISYHRSPFYDNTFDLVLLLDILEHISNPYAAIKEAKRICKDEELILISIPDEEQQHGYRKHNHAFIYPGLFYLNTFTIFLKQVYLKVIYYNKFLNERTCHRRYTSEFDYISEKPIHHVFLCKNMKMEDDKFDIINVVACDFEEEALKYPDNEKTIKEYLEKGI